MRNRWLLAAAVLTGAAACQGSVTRPTTSTTDPPAGEARPAGEPQSTPGFHARAEQIEAAQYVFAPSVTLKGGTKYWFYSSWVPGSVRGFNPITGFSEDGYAGGDMYIAPDLGGSFNALPFRKAAASWRAISFGPPIVYYIPPPGTYVDANFELVGAPVGQ